MQETLPGLGPTVELPEGMLYRPEFLTADEELSVLRCVRGIELHPYVSHGQPSLRRVRSFGMSHVAGAYDTGDAEPWPAELDFLRGRGAALATVDADAIVEMLVTRYPAGAGIGWHRDLPVFGESVVGVSLLAGCTMRFRLGEGRDAPKRALTLERRSAYVLAGPARWEWRHHIAAVPEERWSVTMRTRRS